jgi:two-component system phosphate regulon response regulator PhoB
VTAKKVKSVGNEKRTILVVDDDLELLQLVRVILARLGTDIKTAVDIKSADRILRAHPTPDLLILDVMLPEVSGIDFLRQIRNQPIYDHIPVLVLSAQIDADQINIALSAGADRYLTKPYIANNLVSIVQELLRVGRPHS